MKKFYSILAIVLITVTAWAQSPQKMSYQAVIRDALNHLVTTQVGMRISILQGSESGTAVYAETQTPTPNINGLVTIEIGSGTLVSGNFSTINWANGPYFIKTETAVVAPLTTYTIEGTSPLLSVPYALYAKNAADYTEADPIFAGWDKSSDISITNAQISNWSVATSTFLTGITSGQVTTALGFTPYNSTNPSGYTSNTGTVTSVAMSTPAGLTIAGTPVTTSGTLALTLTSGYAIPTTDQLFPGLGITADKAANGNHTHDYSGEFAALVHDHNGTYEPVVVAGTTSQYLRGDKSWQTLNTSAVIEGSNLYYTDAKARSAISLTTTGNSGAASYSSGIINIPDYTISGLGGQPALNGTGLVRMTGTTVSYDNSIYLTSETDPVFADHVSSGITSEDVTNWSTAYGWGNHSSGGYFANGGETRGTNRTLGNTDNFSLGFKTNDETRLFLSNDGKIGIGTTTPNGYLEVTDKGDGTPYNLIVLGQTETSNRLRLSSGTNYGIISVGSSIDESKGLTIRHSSGYIGMGTSDPSTKLDVNGVITARGGMDAGSNIISNVAGPTDAQDAATKAYVDVSAETNANLTGMVTSVGNETTVVTNADLTGEVMSVGNETTISNSAVISKVLTGFTSAAGKVEDNDNILEAIQKLDGNNPVHYIGEEYGGGFVFYVYDNGQHGLIAATSDITPIKWYAGTNMYTLATSDGVGAGKANTAIILAQQGVGDGTMYAAKACFRYSNWMASVNYSEWYLPSKYELNLLFMQKALTVLNLQEAYYWSSTEAELNVAWAQHMETGSLSEAIKSAVITVRAIRTF
ncbi:MAG: hypothetical protein V1903_00400 [Bacteroidota bacterium]